MQKIAAQETAQGGKHRKTGKRLLRAVACVVVFCTVYALILPALTLERSPECGMEEHRHTEACYTQVDTATGRTPVCTPERLGVHTHTQSCPAANGQYACGQSDYIIHTHDEMCYDENGALWCPLQEMGEHTHTDACYTETQAVAAHEHTDACYSTVRGELICTEAAEAHAHTDACYAERETLLCTQAESEGHSHGESCYDESGALICTLEESEGHSHGADCYGVSRELICTQSEQTHEHTDACYAAERVLSCTLPTEAQESGTRVLICGLQKGLAHQHGADCFQPAAEPDDSEKLTCTKAESDGHKHTERCYGTWALSCGKEEHEHDESCYQGADPGADLESEAVWAQSVAAAERTGDWRHDVVAVAETQIGYAESSRNYITDESGARKGYTRYGAWYGDAYGDWCAMFVSFCMHYAEIPTELFPAESSCQRWVEALKSEEYGFYREAAEYTPEMGDVVFFDWDGDGIANHVGLVAELVYDEQGTETELKTIEGNNGMRVASFQYAIDDRRILGYGEMPEKPETPMRQMGMASVLSGRSGGPKQALDVTDISADGTSYDPENDVYIILLTIDFKIKTAGITADTEFVYNYPKEVIIPPGLLDIDEPVFDKGGIKVGKRRFADNGDGTYSVHVKIDEEYLDSAGAEIIGDLGFGGTLDASPEPDGGIVVDAGGAGLQIVIPADKITYPADETNKYNIDVTKSGSFNPNGNKLNYTVYIRSTKGTPDPIQFNDVINADGLELGTPTVKVEKGEFENRGQWDRPDKQGSFVEVQNPSYTWDSANNKLSMSLDGLPAGADDKTGTCYKITYTYDLPKTGVTQAAPNNKVTAEAEDKTTGQTVKDENNITVHIDKKHSMSKGGWYDESNKRIRWTITINSNYKNIVGALFTDGMLKDSYGLKFEPNDGYELQKDESGKITGIRFTEINGTGINTQKYEIVYFTKPEIEWNDKEIINRADFDPTPEDKDNGDEIPVESKVTVSGAGWVTKSCEGMTPAADGKTGEIDWTVTLKVPATGLPEGIVISDALSSSRSAQHWMTRGQIAGWTPRLTWAGGGTVDPAEENISFYTADGAKYSYAQIRDDTSGTLDGLKFTKFEISFPDGLTVDKADELSFSCRTTADLENAEPGETKYYNRVDVGDKNATAQYAHFKDGVVKTDGSDRTGTSQTSSEGALSWKVKVSTAEACGKLTVTDTLPNGVILDSVSLSGATNMALSIDEYGFITGENDAYRIEGTYRGNEVTLTMTGKNGQTLPEKKQYVFAFDCHADETALEGYGPGQSYTFKNTVTVKADEAEIGSSEQTQEWTNSTPVEVTKIIDKTGSWDNNNRRLNYAIEINPDGEDLVKGTDDLTLIDTLYYSNVIHIYYPVYDAKMKVTLIPESVELYNATKGEDGKLVKGEKITEWSWVRGRKDNGENTEITITAKGIPDKTPLIFLYSYSVESTIKKGTEEFLGIRNTARLEGTSESDSDDAGGVKWRDQTSFGSVTTGKTYTFFKTEENNFGKRLEGAEFTVYRYEPASGPDAAAVTTYTTETNGKFQIEWVDDVNNPYEYGTVYMVTETKAPAGYVLPDTPQVFYFYFSDPTGAVPPPADIPAGAVDLTENSETVYVENEKNAVDITVNKLWFNKDGSPATHNGGGITLELYRRESDRPDAGGDTRLVGEIQCGNDRISFNDSYAPGTTLTFSLTNKQYTNTDPTLSFNGAPLSPIKKEIVTITEGWTREGCKFTYSVVIQGGENTLSGSTNNWNGDIWSGFTVTPPTETGTPQTPIATQTISMADGWQCTFTDLPKIKEENGKKTYYFYYVKEVSVPNYTTSYENNGGIAGGTITVKNTLVREVSVKMPDAGGGGTHAVYAAGAVLTLGAGGLLLYNGKRRRREDVASS